MALKGTIRDFGIADIFQLISQQTKTGVLVLRDEVDEVKISFKMGSVIRAESSTRPKNMLLGQMMLNGELISEEDLDAALKTQSRTLKRLGAILVEMQAVSEADVLEMVHLQMLETVYRLFLWETGTYEFEQTDVDDSQPGISPIRAENILMEGLRIMDEWPSIRDRLPSYSTIFEKLKPIPKARRESNADSPLEFVDLDDMLNDAFDDGSSADIGASERRVYEVVDSHRPLQQLIYCSRLGEFETGRAILELLDHGYIRPMVRVKNIQDAETMDVSRWSAVPRAFKTATVYVILILIAILGIRALELVPAQDRKVLRVHSTVVQQQLAKTQVRTIELALEVFRYAQGQYPKDLAELVASGLLNDCDIRYPYKLPYFYRVLDDGSVRVLPPRY